jgi:energy-coupling factor transporter ATP-binding protein EcfA2
MRLTKISYKQFGGAPQEWTVSDLLLGASNLIVGKNASGKSRTLSVIFSLGKLLSGKQKLEYRSGDYDTLFDDQGRSLRYCLRYEDQKVVKEEFYQGDKKLLSRGPSGVGTIFHEKEEKDLEFQTPDTELASVARRDSIQHAFLEPLCDWGSGVRHYAFGETMGRQVVALLIKDGPPADPSDSNAVIALFRKGQKDYPGFCQAVIDDMCEVGYALTEVGVKTPSVIAIQSPFPVEPTILYVREQDLQSETEQTDMSQGMFRALAITIHINFAILASRPSCIVIDDIGEGLDFDRSCLLIDLVRRKARQSLVQLIMSTNDRFVMNKVPLEEWSVLERHGGQVHVRNYQNSKDKFDQFKFTGLNNFDFFASEFLSQHEEPVANE